MIQFLKDLYSDLTGKDLDGQTREYKNAYDKKVIGLCAALAVGGIVIGVTGSWLGWVMAVAGAAIAARKVQVYYKTKDKT